MTVRAKIHTLGEKMFCREGQHDVQFATQLLHAFQAEYVRAARGRAIGGHRLDSFQPAMDFLTHRALHLWRETRP